MTNRSLQWVTCDTLGCNSSTREAAVLDDADEANLLAERLGWSHYTPGHKGFGPIDVCPRCLQSRPDLAALCALEVYESP